MKIGQRLALRFTLVSALLTGAILVFIYMATRGFVHGDFIERLTKQSSLEVLHYATPHVKEVIPPGSFLLVNPSIAIYSEQGKLLHSEGEYPIPREWVNYLKLYNVYNAERGSYTTVGRKHNVNGVSYLVFVSDKDIPGQHELDILVKALLVGWVLSLVLSYLAGLYFASNALQPVKGVVHEVNQITKDNLSYRLQTEKKKEDHDEIDELLFTFNALLERIESAFVAQKRFVQHASHELKTPLTAIMAEAELALVRDRDTAEYKRTLGVIIDETERLISITQGLLTLARLEEGYFNVETSEIKMESLVNTVIDQVLSIRPQRKISFRKDVSDGRIAGNQQLIEIAIHNLLDNALKYSDNEVHIRLFDDEQFIVMEVEDSGIGIPEQDMARIKAPMFRAQNVSQIQGAGLGLSLVERIASVHKGRLDIQSQHGKGTVCQLRLSRNL